MPIATVAALIELALKIMPSVIQAIQIVRTAEEEKRPLTDAEHQHVAAVVAAGKAHDEAMGLVDGIPASAANAPHGPDFGQAG